MTELSTTVQNSSDEELEPCPICGKSDSIEVYHRKTRIFGRDKWRIQCGAYGCYDAHTARGRTYEKALERWNRYCQRSRKYYWKPVEK